MKLGVMTLLIVLLVLFSSFLQQAVAYDDPSSCDSKCAVRCEKAGIAKRCLTYCGICCNKCKCVPSGNYGNKSECPCYRDMLNSKCKPKCP
ncbi:peamaclein-like [Lycium ferocissimum]|uniref:peamaclein-like n=1 Tax=Lycium ferocissimum TaxID=112874 RepID=UPI00281545B1|nr:peamaclein-like [Lycium ferocissimum]